MGPGSGRAETPCWISRACSSDGSWRQGWSPLCPGLSVRGDTLNLIFPRLRSGLLPEAEGNSRTEPVPPRPHTAKTWFYPRQRAARSPGLGQKRQRQGTVSESRGCWEVVKREDHSYEGGGGGSPTGPSDISDKAHRPIINHYRCQDVDHRAVDSRAQHPSKHGALDDCPGHTPAMLPRPWGWAGAAGRYIPTYTYGCARVFNTPICPTPVRGGCPTAPQGPV